MNVGIICAMKQEVNKLKEIINNLGVKSIKGHIFYIGDINDIDIVLVKNIQGKVNTAICTTLLLNNFDIDMVLNIGYANAIEESLDKGDIAISSSTVEFDIDKTKIGYNLGYVIGLNKIYVPCDENLVKSIHEVVKAEGVNCIIGPVCSGDAYIGESEEIKNKLKEEFNAVAVDMESASVNHVCKFFGKDFVTLRIICEEFDPLEEPEFLNKTIKTIDKILYRYFIMKKEEKIHMNN